MTDPTPHDRRSPMEHERDAYQEVLFALYSDNFALRVERNKLKKAATRVVQAFDNARDTGYPHTLSPAASYALSLLRAEVEN